MKKSILISCFTLLFAQAVSAKDMTFGEGATMNKLESISHILKQPDNFIDKQITVKGEITAVCKKRGCWMELAAADSSNKLKIKVKDGDMVFPVSKKGKTAYATGKLTAKQLSKEQTIGYYQHLAHEQKTKFDSASVKEGMMLYQLVPTGVTIKE